jgi:hypothetical protein
VSTAISVLGGVGLFLLGMTVMTGGLKALAGSSLRAVLSTATTTPISGAIWGAVITLRKAGLSVLATKVSRAQRRRAKIQLHYSATWLDELPHEFPVKAGMQAFFEGPPTCS